MNLRHFSDFIIRPVLAWLDDADPGIASESAVELLLGTAAHESGLQFFDQITGPDDRTLGPAYGLFQIEPATRADVHRNFLHYRPALREAVEALLAPWPSPDVQLATNLAYATAIARLVYRRSPVRLAAPGDAPGHAAVWKRVYNTARGKGTEAAFVDAYRRLVVPNL